MRLNAALCAVLATASPPAVAGIIRVPQDQPTIQAGIDAAVDGDTVLVDAGTWVETIDFLGKAILVESAHGPGLTTIDGAWMGSVVTFADGEGPGTVLKGFTVTRGQGTFLGGARTGGGIRIDGASPSVLGNVIRGNFAQLGGGIAVTNSSRAFISGNTVAVNTLDLATTSAGIGIYVFDSSPRIQGNRIEGNSQQGWIASGGGIFIGGNSSPWIDGNEIARNQLWDGWGAGIAVASGNPMIVRNRIVANFGGGAPVTRLGGGGISVMGGTPTIVANTIEGNRAAADAGAAGGGLFCGGGQARVVSNLFVGNRALDGLNAGGGGAVAVEYGGAITLIGCTLFKNGADHGGGISVWEATSVTVRDCILWDNIATTAPEIDDPAGLAAVTYSDVQGGWPGNGNIDLDPMFVNPGLSDLRLQAGSPCVETGSPSGRPLSNEEFDLQGNSRLLDADFNGAPRVDLGAIEYTEVRLAVTGERTPGGTLTVHTTGRNGLPTFLLAGPALPTPALASAGYLLVSPGRGWFRPWVSANSHVAVQVPPVSAHVTVVLQDLVLSGMGGMLSNPVRVEIK